MPEEEDQYRKKNGWQGEWALFRAAKAQHSLTHPKMDLECEICDAIYRNINRLAAEGEELVNQLKEVRDEGQKLL